MGFGSGLFVPMLREGGAIGSINIFRIAKGAFEAKEVALAQTFADQAVIAIENMRLFNETARRSNGRPPPPTSCSVISSSVDDAHRCSRRSCESCRHLFGSDETAVLLVDDHEQICPRRLRAASIAMRSPRPSRPLGAQVGAVARDPRSARSSCTPTWRTIRSPRAVRDVARAAADTSMACAPMLWNERGIGAIGVSRRAGGFNGNELALLQTFADQAVIAIQNARLFNETREALERQTATAEILKVISESPSSIQPVFDAICERARLLCNAVVSGVARFDGTQVDLGRLPGNHRSAEKLMRSAFPMRPGPSSAVGTRRR